MAILSENMGLIKWKSEKKMSFKLKEVYIWRKVFPKMVSKGMQSFEREDHKKERKTALNFLFYQPKIPLVNSQKKC